MFESLIHAFGESKVASTTHDQALGSYRVGNSMTYIHSRRLPVLFVGAILFASNPATANDRSTGTYYGDGSRRALDGSRRGEVWQGQGAYEPSWSGAGARTYTPEWREPSPPSAPIWNGLYIGLTAGAGRTSVDAGQLDLEIAGALLGAHIGYMARLGPIGAGIELDGSWSHMNDEFDVAVSAGPFGTANIDVTTGVDWLASARARVGVDLGLAFVYATGGVAIAKLSASATAAGASASATSSSTGLVYGAGLELPFTEHLKVRVEALRYEFDGDSVSTNLGDISTDGDITTIRAGLTLYFN